VIKFGAGVTKEEANNQRTAFEVLDPALVRVPELYRYFDKPPFGYIMMEYIEGKILRPDMQDGIMDKLADILAHLASKTGKKPGPFGGGLAQGLLWPDGEEISFRCTEDLQAWMNRRHRQPEAGVNFRDIPLVICHLDFAPRDIFMICFVKGAAT